MAETALAGKGGSIFIPGTPFSPILNIREWTCQINAGNYDASVLGDSWRHFVAGLRDWQGTITGYWNLSIDTTGQKVLFQTLITSGTVVLNMQTAPGGGVYEGTAILTRCLTTDPVDGLITVVFDYIGTGSLQTNFT